jgi:hypothetical protein
MNHFQHPVAQVDQIAMLYRPGGFRPPHPTTRVEPCRDECRICVFRAERGDVALRRKSTTHSFNLGRVDEHLIEGVAVAGVVPVPMRLQHAWPLAGERSDQAREITCASPGVDDRHIPLTLNQVGLHVLALVRLTDHGDALWKSLNLEPGIGHRMTPTLRHIDSATTCR